MNPRIEKELELIKKYYPQISIAEKNGMTWVKVPDYILPSNIGWNKEKVDVAFNFPIGYPGSPPYGIYVPDDLLINEQGGFKGGLQYPPAFEGSWSMISWAPEQWQPLADIVRGANMLNFLKSFYDRFKEGL